MNKKNFLSLLIVFAASCASISAGPPVPGSGDSNDGNPPSNNNISTTSVNSGERMHLPGTGFWSRTTSTLPPFTSDLNGVSLAYDLNNMQSGNLPHQPVPSLMDSAVHSHRLFGGLNSDPELYSSPPLPPPFSIPPVINASTQSANVPDGVPENPPLPLRNKKKVSKKGKKGIYGEGNEAKSVKAELEDFDINNSEAYRAVIRHFGKSVRLTELKGIVDSLGIYLKTKKNIALPLLSRNEKRSFPLLVKYIDRNADLILPCFPYVHLCDANFQKIPLDIPQ